MSQPLLIVILSEALLVFLAISLVLLVIHQRTKRRRQVELEHLLDDIEDRQKQRGQRLKSLLGDRFCLDRQAAKSVADNLILAEKQFLYLFLEQQTRQLSVSGFYENLCTLLDAYLDRLPKAAPDVEAAESRAGGASEPERLAKAEDAPPNWGDVFD